MWGPELALVPLEKKFGYRWHTVENPFGHPVGKTNPCTLISCIQKNVPYYRLLPLDDRFELHQHIQIFINEKGFEGCGGLEITEEIKVTIAAQACILLLHRQTDYYPGLTAILVYPSAYLAKSQEHLPGGVVAEGHEVREGESWGHGVVVLSWEDVLAGAANPYDGHNLVFHEFAHQLDSSAGAGDDSEILRDIDKYFEWAQAIEEDYHKLRDDIQWHRHSLLDEYGGINEAEFFAVATECFFEQGNRMRDDHPQLYAQLKKFYNQDPALLF